MQVFLLLDFECAQKEKHKVEKKKNMDKESRKNAD